ncbi:MAG: hypothetical protein GX128_10555 [Bacteroidales bacterium]|jgi:hypothetical protein|nr:hypothetical protein [Bacteroidales bacterium]
MRIKKHLKACLQGLFFLIPVSILLFSCNPDDLYETSPDSKVQFSNDTIIFDTVFTSIGTATRNLRVYNPYSRTIKISEIRLAGGDASSFRLNIDGLAALQAKDIEITPKDSIFIFIRANIDPSNQNTPLIVTDSILFKTNGNIQDVKLVAWGQDAHFYTNAIVGSDYTLSNDKPHVIYGVLAVDSLYTLTITQGTQLHFHRGSFMLIFRDATLKVLGTPEEPVVFQGNRTEAYYRDLPGQWGHASAGVCIYLYPGSINNEIHHAIIKNGVVGIQADTLGSSSNPTLKIYNSEIKNMSGVGLLARGTHIEAGNTVIANCGESAIEILYGGEYDFRHMTIGNYWNKSARSNSAVSINNYFYFDGNIYVRDLKKAYFGNSIIYGNLENELLFDAAENSTFNYNFDHCFIRTQKDISNDENFVSCIINEDPKFIDKSVHNLVPDTLSPVINRGNISVVNNSPFNLQTDIRGISRITNNEPDPGAYEFEER